MKYLVIGLLHANTSAVVEASSPESAIELAEGELGCPSLCHQCSNEVDLGDIVGFNVIEDEGSGDEVVTHVPFAEEELQRQLDSTRKRLDMAEMFLRKLLIANRTGADGSMSGVRAQLKTNVEKFLAKGAKR